MKIANQPTLTRAQDKNEPARATACEYSMAIICKTLNLELISSDTASANKSLIFFFPDLIKSSIVQDAG